MDPLDGLFHLLGFAAPALGVGLLVALAARLVTPTPARRVAWWKMAAINTIAGLIALGGGLWYFGVDGKMATYAALVLAVASSQWLATRSWQA